MYLEKLEIQGFKSFADKTTLTFDKGNTAVVGPNGSGKSNVADAVRWVLGEQSLKMLRGKKSEDVIFAGSDARPQMSMCEVSLYLNNESGKMPVDFPEVVITRKLYRNGDSEYLINKSTVRLIDIVELLAKSGFGQKTYSVIGQGMIDAFITASPSERKLLFEEAAGVKQYQLKRNQTVRKLDVTKQNLERVSDLLRELKPRLKSLERQAKRAEEREVLQKELKDLQIKWFSYFHADLKTRLKEINAQYIEAEAAHKEIDKDYRELETKLHEASQDAGHDRRKYEELQDQLTEEQGKKNALEGELSRLTGLIEVEKERDYSQDQKALSAQKSILEKELLSLKQTLQDLEAERDRAKKAFDEKQMEVSEINEKVEALREKMKSSQSGDHQSENKSPEVKSTVKEIARAQKSLIKEIENVSDFDQLSDVKELAAEISDRLEELSTQLDDGQAASAQELIAIQNELNALLEQKEGKSHELSEISVKLRTAEGTITSHENRRDTLETELKGIEQKLEIGKGSKADADNITYLADKKKDIEDKVGKLSTKIIDTRNALKTLDEEELSRKQGFIEVEKSLRERREALSLAQQKKNNLEVEKARLEVKKEDLDREIGEDIGFDALRNLTDEESAEIGEMSDEQKEKEHKKIEHLQVRLTQIGGIEEDVLEEHKEVEERFAFLSEQSEDLERAAKDLRQVIEKLDKTIKRKFNEAFRNINKEFDKFFKILFNGGTAKLSLVRPDKKKKKVTEEMDADEAEETDLDQEDPTLKASIEGVEIKANPPGKKLKGLAMLSGGEKAMTSIALLCAIVANNPSPFVVLDEVDAALDDANARRFARIVDKLDNLTQFIVITHNHETMRMAQILYGITMQRDGVSKMLSIKLDDVDESGQIKGEEHVAKK